MLNYETAYMSMQLVLVNKVFSFLYNYTILSLSIRDLPVNFPGRELSLKTNRLCTSILLLLPSLAFSMGLGDMNVTSFLNQQFHAEIPLLDVGNVPLSGIRVSLASLNEFERIGLNRAEFLDYLQFQVAKNNKGQSVIQVTSTERITEPYLQILIDLAWANGQLYRSYTVLLDPPNYALDLTGQPIHQSLPVQSSYAKEPGVIDKPVYTEVVNTSSIHSLQHEEATYGPTLVNESIWQIAQRYATPSLTMSQIILAIVGTNSQAFTQGNLNGLKASEQLNIPSTKEIMKIPADLAKQEVEAHDVAWNTHQQIKHVLLPPYIEGKKGISQFDKNSPADENAILPSELPATPVFAQTVTAENPPIATTTVLTSQENIVPNSYLPSIPIISVAQPVVSVDAFEQVRRENALLKKEVDKLKADKQSLTKTIIPPKASVAVSSQQEPDDKTNIWFYPVLLAAIAAGAGFGYRINSKRRDETSDVIAKESPSIEPMAPISDVNQEPKQTDALIHFITETKEPVIVDTIPEVAPAQELHHQADEPKEEEPVADDYLLDFEPGLDQFIHAESLTDKAGSLDKPDSDLDIDLDLDNLLHKAPATTHELDKLSDELALTISADLHLDDNQQDGYEFHHDAVEKEPLKPVKSHTALDTLLALAKTYIAMDDFDTARQSLQEVLDFGNEAQQQAAKLLLDELNAQ